MKRNSPVFIVRRITGLFIPLILVAGCATAEKESQFLLVDEEEVLVEAPAAEEAAPARRRPTAAGPRKPLPPLTLTTIVGRDEAGTVELLGQPAHVRVESPATIWTYSRGTCDLEIYFYPSLRERRLQSLTYEIRGQNEETDCLNEFGLAEDGTS